MAEAIRTCYCNCAVYETLHTVFVSTAFKRKTSTISVDAHCAPLLKYRSEGKTNSQSFSRVQYGSFLLDSSCLYFLCGLRCSQEVQRNYSLTKNDIPCFSSFVLFKEENAGTSLTLVTFKKKIKILCKVMMFKTSSVGSGRCQPEGFGISLPWCGILMHPVQAEVSLQKPLIRLINAKSSSRASCKQV